MEHVGGVVWLFRGVPRESAEVKDVESIGEIRSPRPDRIGKRWREFHIHGNTESGYTSWTTDIDIAREAALFASEAPGLSGEVVIFRVKANSIADDRIFSGLEDECEFLIEGTVENVAVTAGDENEVEVDDE